MGKTRLNPDSVMSTAALRVYLETIEGDETKIAEVFSALQSAHRFTEFIQTKGISLTEEEAAGLRKAVLKKDIDEIVDEKELDEIIGSGDIRALISLLR